MLRRFGQRVLVLALLAVGGCGGDTPAPSGAAEPTATATEALTAGAGSVGHCGGNPARCTMVMVGCGSLHTVALGTDRTVWTWGLNDVGQLGDGTVVGKALPVAVPSLSDVVAIAVGQDHTVALKADGAVWAWGNNEQGQLGDGSVTARTSPVQVASLSGVAAVASRSIHTAALKADGTVWGWGFNEYGQLGDGTTVGKTVPTSVPALSGVTAIAVGERHTVALKGDGTLSAWGGNSNGQLGDGTNMQRPSPVSVPAFGGVSAVSAGQYHTLALKADGTVWAWGYNHVGQLGDGTTLDKTVPTQLSSLSGVVAIASGRFHAVALKADGTLLAWGDNNAGQLGDGTTEDRHSPTPVSALSGVVAIAAGSSHTLALKADGTLWAWGEGNAGQLGGGTTTNRSLPTQVGGGLNLAAACMLSACGAGGACLTKAVADGSSCNDGSACSRTDTCHAGTCTGANPITCAGHGTCSNATGDCSCATGYTGPGCDGCAAGYWGYPNCQLKGTLGEPCASAGECSGGQCVDGVCCNSSCTAQCEACDVTGQEGTCTAATGQPHGARALCATDGSACGGACDGVKKSGCLYPTSNCRAASCDVGTGVATQAAACSGQGNCPSPPSTIACTSGQCAGTACDGDCTIDSDCTVNEFCAANQCTPKRTAGAACGSGAECTSTFCVDGVCCASACAGQCEACAENGSEGSCVAVSGEPRAGRDACAGVGACVGSCNGTASDACTYPGASVSCAQASCISGSAMSSTCDGNGACEARAATPCGAYACGAEACNTDCATSGDCATGYSCQGSTCVDGSSGGAGGTAGSGGVAGAAGTAGASAGGSGGTAGVGAGGTGGAGGTSGAAGAAPQSEGTFTREAPACACRFGELPGRSGSVPVWGALSLVGLFVARRRRLLRSCAQPLVALVIASTLLGVPTPAHAQSDEVRAGARAAAMEGVRAYGAKRWAEAIDYFTKAESLVHAPTHLLYMARAHASLGQLVKAREAYLKLVKEQLAPTAPQAFQEAKRDGASELTIIEKRLPSVRVLVQGAKADVTAMQDEVAFPSVLIGVPRPVDPGKYTFRAFAPGLASDSVSVELVEGQREVVTLVLKPSTEVVVDAASGANSGAPQVSIRRDDGDAARKSEPAKDGLPATKLWAYVGLGAGALGLGVGTVFAIVSHGKRAEGDDLCPGGTCQAKDQDQLDDLDSQATLMGQLSTVGFAVGAAGVITGVTLLLLGREEPTPSKVGRLTPWVGVGAAGVSGAF